MGKVKGKKFEYWPFVTVLYQFPMGKVKAGHMILDGLQILSINSQWER